MAQREIYKFRKTKQSRYYQVMFKHIPGKWFSTASIDMAGAVLFAENFLEKELQKPSREETLRTFSKDFFKESDPKGFRNRQARRGKTYSDYFFKSQQALLENYIIPRFGDYLLNSITDVMIEDWIIDLCKYSDDTQDLSNDTKNKILMCLRTIFQEARRSGCVSENPARSVQLLPEKKKHRLPINRGELAVLFPSSDDDLIRVWGDLYWACYFLVMRDTGFRPGEVAALSTKNWVRQFHGLYTKDSIMQATRQLQHSIKTSSKGQSYKIGILTDQTERLLAQREQQIEPEEYFFLLDGRFLRPEVSNKHFKGVLKRQGIELDGRSQYSLRHSFETDLAGAVENKVLLELMAHTSYRAEYDHRTPEDLLRQLQPVRKILEDRENH